MRNIFLYLILFLLTNFYVSEENKNTSAPQEKIEIYVNGETFDPDRKSLDYNDTIEFRLTNIEKGAVYKFDKIRLEWLVKKKIIGMQYEGRKKYIYERQKQQGRRRIFNNGVKNKEYLAHDLKELNNTGYQTLSKHGSVKIVFNQFAFLPCLSRVVFHLENIVKVKNNRTTTINPKDLNLITKHKDDGISFFPKWDTCRH